MKRIEEIERKEFAKGGRAKWSQKYDPTIPKDTGTTSQTIGTQSVSGPSGPSQPAGEGTFTGNRYFKSDNQMPLAKIPPSLKTSGNVAEATDGKTKVKYNLNDDISAGARQAYFNREGQWPPCINTSCKSYGKSHPNCLCYGPLNASEGDKHWFGSFAKGGEVCSHGMNHHENCEHFATGGEIEENNMIANDPQSVLDHAAIHHGLLGLMTKIGKTKSEDPNKHIEDYLGAFKKGRKTLKHQTENLFKGHHETPEKSSREALKEHLVSVQEHPEQLLEIGGALPASLPHHGVQLAAKAGTAINYLNRLKPQRPKHNPLDEVIHPDKMKENHYDRSLDIAQHPLSILQHVRDGMLLPSDIQTLSTIYPSLHKEILSHATKAMITAVSKGEEIPYRQKQSLSLLLGQPLDGTMTPQAMQAIIQSQGPQQAQQQSKGPKKATGVELKEVDKVTNLYETPSERREMGKRD